MTVLKIDNTKARGLYKTASQEFKTMLEDTFGKDFFSQKITDRIKTFEDACEALGLTPEHPSIVNINGVMKSDGASIAAYIKLTIIIRALNEGWTPDWSNASERKWWPVFEYKKGSGFGLRVLGLGHVLRWHGYGCRLPPLLQNGTAI